MGIKVWICKQVTTHCHLFLYMSYPCS